MDAHRDVDVALRRRLAMKRPQDTTFDETLRGPKMFAGRIWVIDPLDGGKNFIRGVPVWATLIALMVDGVPTVGVVSAPALHRRWWAAAGDGACATRWTEPARRLSVSAIEDLGAASLCFSSLSGWGVLGLRERFIVLADDVWRARGYGDFYSYCLVAEGVADIALAAQVSVRQLAAVDILIHEAGGTFTDLGGSRDRTARPSQQPMAHYTMRSLAASPAPQPCIRRCEHCGGVGRTFAAIDVRSVHR